MNRPALAEFADKINEIIPVIGREFAKCQSSELYKAKITFPQFMILMLLHREGESRMSDLAHLMNVTTAAMTGMVDRLVRDSYLVRAYDPEDRRIIKVKLTAKGSQLARGIHRGQRRTIIRVFGKMSEADRGDYLRILTQIKDILLTEDSAKK